MKLRWGRQLLHRPRQEGTDGPVLPPPWDPRLPGRLAAAFPLTTVAVVGFVAILLSGVLEPLARGDGADAQPESATGAEGDAAGSGAQELVPGTIPPSQLAPDRPGALGGVAMPGGDGAGGGPGEQAAAAVPADSALTLGPAAPARLGTYQLAVTMDGQTIPGAYSVRAGGSGHSQVHRTEVDGSGSEQVLSYGDGGITLQAVVDAALGECRWSPAAVVAPAQLDVGSTWSSSSDCTATPNGASVSIHQESDARVESRGHTMVGGQLVEVWVVQRHETQTRRTGGTTAVSEVVASELLAPQLGIVVERQTRADMPFPDGTVQSVTVMERIQALPA